jgi:uncharacterized protein (TIGR03663 family)
MSRGVIAGLLLAIIIAIALRCPNLAERPMHTDEAVNAIKFGALMEQGTYRYDPNEHHGPTLYYFTLAWTKLLGVTDFTKLTEAQLRGLTLLFGVGVIVLLGMVADGLGRGATICAALFTAISPAMVFYSDYFIHEMLLVFFAFLALGSFWRHYRSGKLVWAMIAGAAVGLMQSTKETFVLSLAAVVAALLLNKLWTRSDDPRTAVPRKIFKPITAGVIAWLIVATLFFSSFFTNAGGLLDSVRTYLPWLNRAAGDSPHIHPWNFYLARLAFFHVKSGPVWSESLIWGLAAIGAFAAFTRKGAAESKGNFLRFVSFYTLALFLIYSFIGYKTPWCLLNFWHGAILLAGAGAVAVWNLAKARWMKCVAALLMLGAAAQLASQAWRAGGTFSADAGNPYVYAQTSEDFLELVERLEGLARAHPQSHRVHVQVFAPGGDYWPLPWYLRRFEQVGWWSELDSESPAPVMILSTQFTSRLEENKSHQAAGLFQLRPGVFLALYVEGDLWRAYVNSRPQ